MEVLNETFAITSIFIIYNSKIHNFLMFRPPAEAYSLIITIADGCPWNKCTFCGMYKNVNYKLHSFEEIKKSITKSYKSNSNARRIFLADGDVMALSFEKLEEILKFLNSTFPKLSRVNIYANGNSILNKSNEQLILLKKLKLNTLYMGLETGDEITLKNVKKRETAEEMIEAGQRAQTAGLRMSVMILIGLGGQQKTDKHAVATAEVLNKMQPKLLSALRVIPIPKTELFEAEQTGKFKQLTEFQAIEELHKIIENLTLKNCVFRANHSSNILPLEGRFSKDKERLLHELELLLNSGNLNKTSPAQAPLWL